ncbi:hypothetical protein D3C71_2046410 [compost metagenome]
MVGAYLAHDAQAVGGVASLQIRIHCQRGLELGQLQGFAHADHLDAEAQHFQRAALVELFAQAIE